MQPIRFDVNARSPVRSPVDNADGRANKETETDMHSKMEKWAKANGIDIKQAGSSKAQIATRTKRQAAILCELKPASGTVGAAAARHLARSTKKGN